MYAYIYGDVDDNYETNIIERHIKNDFKFNHLKISTCSINYMIKLNKTDIDIIIEQDEALASLMEDDDIARTTATTNI